MYEEMNNPSTFVPTHDRESIKRWVEKGIPMGGFLMSVAENNLQMAVLRADMINKKHLSTIVNWFWNHAPMGCWGSEDNVTKWLNKGGENV